LLDRVLTNILDNVSGIRLLELATDETADVVITTGKGVATSFDDDDSYSPPTKLLIIIDWFRNVLYVRHTNKQGAGVEILPGEIPVLLDILNHEVSKNRLRLIDNLSA